MKIHKLSHVIAVPFALMLCYILYETFLNDSSTLLLYGMFPAAVLILIYLFQPQINYWWLSNNPIAIDDKVLKMLERTNPVYRIMFHEDKRLFQNRLVLYTEGNAFMSKGMEQDFDVPYDVKMMTGQIPITMMWNKKDIVLKAFERIVIYKHPFPSPKFKFLHTAETDIEDGVIIYSLEHMEAAFLNPTSFYNVAWHAYAEAYVKAYPQLDYPELDASVWQIIEKSSGLERDTILNILGFETVDLLPILITCYFLNGEKLRNIDSDIFSQVEAIFA